MHCVFKLQWNPSGGARLLDHCVRALITLEEPVPRYQAGRGLVVLDTGWFCLRLKRMEWSERLENHPTMRFRWALCASYFILLPLTGKKTTCDVISARRVDIFFFSQCWLYCFVVFFFSQLFEWVVSDILTFYCCYSGGISMTASLMLFTLW